VESACVTKILDNSAISAFINDIPSVQVLVICSKQYALVSSIEVYFEAVTGSDQKTIDSCFSKIQVIDKNPQEMYGELIADLSDRYPYLHKGDISSFLVAYLDYATNGKPHYLVTDDWTLRRRIPDLLTFMASKGGTYNKSPHINVTGIIGLMRHIADNGELSDSDIEAIIADLKRSTFYVTEDLLSYLRSGKK